MFLKSLRYFISATILCMTPMIATAQVSLDQLLGQGKYAEALALVDTALQTTPSAPDLHLMRSYALLGLDDLAGAEAAANRAAETEAAFLHHMLRGHIAAGNEQHNIANFWYRRAHDAAKAPAQTATAVAFSRGAQAARNWVWGAEFNMRQSNNLNFATDEDTVELGGLPFTLSEDSTAQAGVTIAAAFSGKYKVINASDHLLHVGMTAQLSFQQGEGVTSRGLGFVIDGQRVLGLGSDDPINLHYGLTVSRSFPVGSTPSHFQGVYLQAGGALTERLRWTARADAGRNVSSLATQTDLSLTLGLSGTFENGLGYGVSITQARINSDNANVAATERGIKVSLQPQIDVLPVSVGLFAEYTTRDFARETPFFGGMRRDQDFNFGITLAPKDYTVMGMVPSITIRQSQRNSNIDINDADSRDIFVGLQSSF